MFKLGAHSVLSQHNQWVCLTPERRAQDFLTEGVAAFAQSEVSERLPPPGKALAPSSRNILHAAAGGRFLSRRRGGDSGAGLWRPAKGWGGKERLLFRKVRKTSGMESLEMRSKGREGVTSVTKGAEGDLGEESRLRRRLKPVP